MSAAVRTVEVAVVLPWGRVGEPDPSSLGRELRLLWLIEEVRRHRLRERETSVSRERMAVRGSGVKPPTRGACAAQTMSVGKASSLAEMPRAAFMRMLGDHGVPVIDYDVEDLDRELGTLGLG